MDKKWTIGLGLLGILIVFLLLWNFAPAIQRWLASVFVDIILLLAAFAAGWLFGRFGGKRRRSDDAYTPGGKAGKGALHQIAKGFFHKEHAGRAQRCT